MPVLDVARDFYYEYGKPMLEREFADVKERIAAGLCGEGSECLLFDDAISLDHDVDMGFCLFITREDERAFGFRLERAYAKLPKEYRGFSRLRLSPVGGNRHGVIAIEDFYERFLGAENAPDSIERWLYTPSQSLLCASNGKVFEDPLGKFSKVRQVLEKGYPEDIRLKKLAAHTVMAAQAGQYNYPRCLKRLDIGAAQLALCEFVRHVISAVYLLNNRYEPYYKWAFRGMRVLARLSSLRESLETLLSLGGGEENTEQKMHMIESISASLIAEMQEQGITNGICNDLEKHAYSIMDHIKNGDIRNMHIMEGA